MSLRRPQHRMLARTEKAIRKADVRLAGSGPVYGHRVAAAGSGVVLAGGYVSLRADCAAPPESGAGSGGPPAGASRGGTIAFCVLITLASLFDGKLGL